MKRLLVLASALLLLAACSSSSNGQAQNDLVIANAQAEEQGDDAILATLTDKLNGWLYLGNVNFRVPVGSSDSTADGQCVIYQILNGEDQIRLYSAKDPLISPDGQTGIHINMNQGTRMSDCMIAVRDALGW